MGSNLEEALDWDEYKLLILIPFTLILCTNIHFDFVKPPRLLSIDNIQNSEPIFDESPLRTSLISCLALLWVFGCILMVEHVFYYSIVILDNFLVILLIKGPLIAIWTHHQSKQKNLKKNQQEINEVELTLSAQAENSQLESHVLNDIQNNHMNVP